jgi:3-deoxy-manno-octulosonate cytidylyltransferase (CMP-KDO synthetase)
MNSKKVIICIPARYGSSRFPGKPLAKLAGKPIIQWAYERACQSLADKVVIATDDDRIVDVIKSFGGNYAMTSSDHPSGTDRIWEAIRNETADIIINIQGDEPLININTVNKLIESLKQNPVIEMGTVVQEASREEIGKDPNVVKVVLDKNQFALYFSRSEIPCDREGNGEVPLFHHVGIYAYRYETLKKFVSLEQGILERCEKLEQLRALENGVRIYAVITNESNGIGIDTPQDLEKAEKIVKELALA